MGDLSQNISADAAPKKLRLLGCRLVLQPLRRVRTEGSIIMVDRYNDDRQQWLVLQRGPLVDPTVQPGSHVLMSANFEPQHEFSDGVCIADARLVQAVFVNSDG